MKSFSLFLSLLLGVSFVTSSVKGVTYCVQVNETSHCQCQPCHTLQYFLENVNTTINNLENKEADVTMIFMPGIHNVNFTERINITAPASLTMTGLDNASNITVIANHTHYKTVADTGLLFEWRIVVRIEGFTFDSISIRLNNANATLHNCHLIQSVLNINLSTVIFSGESKFADSSIFTIYSHASNITLSTGDITFTHNTAFGGGAMYLESSSSLNIANGSVVKFSSNIALDRGGAIYLVASKIYIAPGASVTFANNKAYDKGGAIYFQPGITLSQILSQVDPHKCFFYQSLKSGSTEATYINFTNNTAETAGDDIYGASVDECSSESNKYKNNIIHRNPSDAAVSLVSSDPLRVCECENDVPCCDKASPIGRNVTPGGLFDVCVAVVGWDYRTGITNSMIYQYIEYENLTFSESIPVQHVGGKHCTKISLSLPPKSRSFNLSSPLKHIKMYLTAVNPTNTYTKHLRQFDETNHTIHYATLTYNIIMNPCPSGFYLSDQRCNCLLHSEAFQNCSINNGLAYFSWNSTKWVNTENGSVVYAQYCPFDYCNKCQATACVQINLPDEADFQCAYNRTGRLCGKCKQNESYSLAIGSSQCVPCKNNNGLALFVFFAAAGFLLVFIIRILNLTVTQGMINGLLYYANIIWAYQSIFFPPQISTEGTIGDWFRNFEFLRVFIAWLNLDFGIQMCFFKGLDALGKTLLQYLFPIYLWIIAGAIIACAHYSTKMTKLFGNKVVPVVATLFLFSSTKLLKIIIDSIAPTPLIEMGKDNHRTMNVYWSLDGSYRYFLSWHAVIFLIAVFVFIFLWLPYTLLLFLMQWIRRKSHLRLLKWIPRLTPLYDAYFAPLKDKHHYWFGVLLVTRCTLLIIFISTYTIYPKVNYILLLVTTALLLCYSNYYRVYKNKHVQLSENFFFLQVVLVGGAGVFEEKIILQYVVHASVIIVVFAFCGLVIWNLCKKLSKTSCWKGWKKRREYNNYSEFDSEQLQATLVSKEDLQPVNARYRDSILDTTIEVSQSLVEY